MSPTADTAKTSGSKTGPTAADLGGPKVTARDALLHVRAGIGGVLMGLANLVPGVSGGTMLLATGVYPRFIAAVADVTRLRWRFSTWLLLGIVVGAAGVAILLLAGPTKTLVVEHRWIMYSLFIGLTLGGVPIVWRLLRPAANRAWGGAVAGLTLMIVLLFVPETGASDPRGATVLLFLSGLAGASAMILPGISGGYLLLLLGQYVPILGAVDHLKLSLTGGSGGGLDVAGVVDAGGILLPVGLGVAIGVLGVSNLLKWLLEHQRQVTLGVLLGLLLGAAIGLWPFQRPVTPRVGDVVRGIVVTRENLAGFDPEDYPLQRFRPGAGQVAASLGLILVGFGVTLMIGRLQRESGSDEGPSTD